MDNAQPIIIKRVKKVVGGHHGGAWKIAFADFATAMMAFFLVLWLLSSATPEQLKAVSGYFEDPIGFSESASPYVIDLGGSPQVSPNKTLNKDQDTGQQQRITLDKEQVETLADRIEQERLSLLMQELQQKVDESPELKRFSEQIMFEITPDGLRIQITDAENRPMFSSGSAHLQPHFEEILLALADTIRAVPNKISIGGHTDAQPYVGRKDYSNWELSSERANAARRALEFGGYPDGQVARVAGYGSSSLFDASDELNPTNRRIDIMVLTKQAQAAIEGETHTPEVPVESAVTPEAAAPVSGAAGQPAVNIFESGGPLSAPANP
ncbi:flagellar motor protein MotB [Atopomonas sediminilitoris]|uniref:flagellar motor protein MotB n=1 Tax=Atopomonas sediminilitoris TaxID=2919919 RepID=UPI001F4E0670|nr:flagellar motor protein MotB [Atopomonas sediminilitoris]MCJ8170256.1 flagellar motor protein MotB [Atopomonas sediminilitoris]